MDTLPDVERLRGALGLPSAPLVTANLQVVCDYFASVLDVSPLAWVSYLRGIDFHKPVQQMPLLPGRHIVRHRPDERRPKPFLYFAEVGASPMRTGTNFPAVTFERFAVRLPIPALESSASSIAFGPADRVSRPGGATQYIIPTRCFGYLQPA